MEVEQHVKESRPVLQSHHTGIEIWKLAIETHNSNSFNRTTQELKSIREYFNFYTQFAFNRTTQELKYAKWGDVTISAARLQSHHTGIEIEFQEKNLATDRPLQSHHTGIEISF